MDIFLQILVLWGIASAFIVPVIDYDRRDLEHKLRIAEKKLDLYRDSAADQVAMRIKFESECV